mmetsp:Transcript_15780/g.39825  ORF Transcript_15780/g.39825 Transcript_15780/m.39825 type:complete len:81 (+) Transcript_15780:75-317(+)
MSQFFQRIAQYLANELVTKRLANSQTFMSAAHKTHQNVQRSQELLKTGKGQAVEQSKSAFSFLGDVRRELAKELTGKGKP